MFRTILVHHQEQLYKLYIAFCIWRYHTFVGCCEFFILVCVEVVGLVAFVDGYGFIYLALCFCLCVYFLVVWGVSPLWYVFSFDWRWGKSMGCNSFSHFVVWMNEGFTVWAKNIWVMRDNLVIYLVLCFCLCVYLLEVWGFVSLFWVLFVPIKVHF